MSDESPGWHPQAKIGFDNGQYVCVWYWPFIHPNGQVGIQSRVRIWDGACVVALDEETRKVFLIRRQRETNTGPIMTIELPGGGCEAGETPRQTAERELLEEVGAQATEEAAWVQLLENSGGNPLPGILETHQHAFLCTSARKVRQPEQDETIEVILKSFDEVIEMDQENAFRDLLSPYYVRRAYDHLWHHPNLLSKNPAR